jgi:Mn-dependent DtxR family transcriptional regulator
MDRITYYEYVETLLSKIQIGKISAHADICAELEVSLSTSKRMIKYLKENNHPVYYSKREKKFLLKK